MATLTKPKIEAVSRFLQGLRMCGAVYTTTEKPIVHMPDGTSYRIEEKRTGWTFRLDLPDLASVEFVVRADLSPRKIQLAILENHCKILRKFS